MEPMEQQVSVEQERQSRAAMPAARPAEGDVAKSQRLVTIITRTVEDEVIPRLVRSLGGVAASPATAKLVKPPSPLTGVEVAELVRLVMAQEEARSVAFVEALHHRGIPAETLYLDLLAPTARQLGQMWTDDECDFTEVTVGLFLLQNALRELGATFQADAATDAVAPRALLVPLPGEQHTFGLSMVFDFFRRAGWNAWTGPVESDGELATMVRSSWFDVVGFSLACDEQLGDAVKAIRLVRKASRNPDVAIMVGGPGFATNPALAALVEADGTAVDGRQAVEQANALFALARSRRCS